MGFLWSFNSYNLFFNLFTLALALLIVFNLISPDFTNAIIVSTNLFVDTVFFGSS